MTVRRSDGPAKVMVSFRATPTEKARLKEQARAAGVSLSDYVRVKALGFDQDPEYVRAAVTITNNLAGMESVVAAAKALLAGKGAP